MDKPKSMPVLGVTIAIIQGEQVMLTRRRDFEVWCLPGGEVDPGESLSQAAIREVAEETGLQVHLDRLVGVHSRPQWLGVGGHVVLFAASVTGGKLIIQPQEVIEARFFARDELPGEMLLGHLQQVKDALDGVRGAAWTHESELSFETGLTRRELYHQRDLSGLSPAEFYLQRVGKPLPGGSRLELPGKVDVY